MSSSNPLIVWLTTNPVTTFLVRRVFSRLDPIVFRKTNGRFTAMGPPSMPMLTLTMVGRRSGKPRSVHLACLEQGDDFLVVASAMGQERHPSWRYNLEANPDVEVQVSGRSFSARAEILSDVERESVWSDVHDAIPQMKIYEGRTDRNIRMFRLRSTGAGANGR
jgi:deazaflavin-dependent oxidoreductase (nitroreductase family)